jgi:hypothetical protein
LLPAISITTYVARLLSATPSFSGIH